MVERKEIEELVRKRMKEKYQAAGKKEYIVAANWKMNLSEKETKNFLAQMNEEEIPVHVRPVIFPPYPYLSVLKKMLRYSRITYGAQDIAQEDEGAYTGEVSAAMLLDMGCVCTLTGHSERRSYYGETSEVTARKAAKALEYRLTPFVCIGETLEERRSGRYKETIKMQLDAVEREIGAGVEECVFAYEPVWAIGTGVIPGKQEIAETHRFIYETLASYGHHFIKSPRILYGGSVNEKNVRALASIDYVDGFLIGGASLRPESFKNILKLLCVDG